MIKQEDSFGDDPFATRTSGTQSTQGRDEPAESVQRATILGKGEREAREEAQTSVPFIGRAAIAAAEGTREEREPRSTTAAPKPELTISDQDLAPVSSARTSDPEAARRDLGVNSLEPGDEREMQKLANTEEAQRAARLSNGRETQRPAQGQSAAAPGNYVESDEIFTAPQRDAQPMVPADIEQKFVRKGDEFYNHPDATRLVFQDKGNKLETRSDGEQVAEAMVRIAESRGWDEIKVQGSETFRREAWLEAAGRGMQVKGYSPTEQDKAELATRKGNEVAKASERETPNQAKARVFVADRDEAVRTHPELAGAAAAAVAIAKRAKADGLTPKQQAVVQDRVRQNLVNSIERGNSPTLVMREEVETRVEVETTRELGR